MEDFNTIVQHCQAQSRIARPVVDEFLIYYAAKLDQLERKMNQKLKQYQHIARKLPDRSVNIFKSEYIAAQIFRKNGLIGKYLQHTTIKALGSDAYAYLKHQYEHPWRFSFAIILDRPADDFFQMHDVFTQEEYLLYSPGMSATLAEEPFNLWFNLVSFNGQCWQTFGVIMGFRGFTPNDIFFFGTELHPDLVDETGLMQAIEKDPWPFFMLISRSTIPLTYSQDALLVYHSAMDELSVFPSEQLKGTFDVRWKNGIYALRLGNWSEPPHFAQAYYDESQALLHRFASTEAGFTELTKVLLQQGLSLDPEPQVEVTPAMLITTEEILRRRIQLNPYEENFVDRDPVKEKATEKINHLLQLVMPFINNNEPIDIEQLATEAGVELQVAQELLEMIKGRIGKL